MCSYLSLWNGPILISKEKWMDEPKFIPSGSHCYHGGTCVPALLPKILSFRCFFVHFLLFLPLPAFHKFPQDMIPLLVLILSHFYVIKPDEAPGSNTHDESRELFLIPGMPMLNNTAQLLEWTASYINGFQSFWCDALF